MVQATSQLYRYPGPRFTNDFSIAVQIRWKFRFTLISILIQWSLQNFVHGTTAVLSWHVQTFVAICWPATELWQGEVSIEFELQAKSVSETGPSCVTGQNVSISWSEFVLILWKIRLSFGRLIIASRQIKCDKSLLWKVDNVRFHKIEMMKWDKLIIWMLWES